MFTNESGVYVQSKFSHVAQTYRDCLYIIHAKF